MKNLSLPRTPAEKRDFFTGILCAPRADEKLKVLADSGILEDLFPEIDAMRGVTQPPEFHPEGDVFEHTMLMHGRVPPCGSPHLSKATGILSASDLAWFDCNTGTYGR